MKLFPLLPHSLHFYCRLSCDWALLLEARRVVKIFNLHYTPLNYLQLAEHENLLSRDHLLGKLSWTLKLMNDRWSPIKIRCSRRSLANVEQQNQLSIPGCRLCSEIVFKNNSIGLSDATLEKEIAPDSYWLLKDSINRTSRKSWQKRND